MTNLVYRFVCTIVCTFTFLLLIGCQETTMPSPVDFTSTDSVWCEFEVPWNENDTAVIQNELLVTLDDNSPTTGVRGEYVPVLIFNVSLAHPECPDLSLEQLSFRFSTEGSDNLGWIIEPQYDGKVVNDAGETLLKGVVQNVRDNPDPEGTFAEADMNTGWETNWIPPVMVTSDPQRWTLEVTTYGLNPNPQVTENNYLQVTIEDYIGVTETDHWIWVQAGTEVLGPVISF